jgi:hypothetical protein
LAGTFSYAIQSISLPETTSSITLTFWYNGGSEQPLDGSDYQAVSLWSPGQTLIEELMRVKENDRVWKPASFDLSALSERQFALWLLVYNDSTGPDGRTWLYVDDVSMVACP